MRSMQNGLIGMLGCVMACFETLGAASRIRFGALFVETEHGDGLAMGATAEDGHVFFISKQGLYLGRKVLAHIAHIYSAFYNIL